MRYSSLTLVGSLLSEGHDDANTEQTLYFVVDNQLNPSAGILEPQAIARVRSRTTADKIVAALNDAEPETP